MWHIYEDDNTEALLLVDAENAFNVLNRKAALHMISILCPVMLIILRNTYGGTSDLYVSGEILVRWRNHTGRPPGNEYVHSGHNATSTWVTTGTKQIWFADDATGGGTLKEVRSWWDQLNRNGLGWDYHPKASKLWLIVKEVAAEETVQGNRSTDHDRGKEDSRSSHWQQWLWREIH